MIDTWATSQTYNALENKRKDKNRGEKEGYGEKMGRDLDEKWMLREGAGGRRQQKLGEGDAYKGDKEAWPCKRRWALEIRFLMD